jgi:predicted metal-dependent phosphotriesterase family hydrolase
MLRRDFLKKTGCLAWTSLCAVEGLSRTAMSHSSGATRASVGTIQTVAGPIRPEDAGITLPHEHIMSLFGAEITEKPTYDEEQLYKTVLPYLRKLKEMGCGTIADCTTAYFGRSPRILKKVSEETGLSILTNTGYYAAANDKYVPPHAYKESAEQLAIRWIKEFEDGIEGTGIRPGFIKIGVDSGPLSEIDRKIVRAAALTNLETGLTTASHTGDNLDSVKEQLQIFKEEGASPSAWIWVHSNNVKELAGLLFAADQGAWVELDGVRSENAEQHLKLVTFLKEKGYFKQVLLSHDGNSFRYGDRPAKAYDWLFEGFIPLLASSGFSESQVKALTVDNPARALSIMER